jgi:16S rRNA (guanine(966)-N(2))-methyltransferase RsmD
VSGYIRVISGVYKGLKLKIPSDYDIRPTQDRVKESIFNVLGMELEARSVLDLFSGSGSLGIEAISRGAAKVYFVDNSFKSIKLIKSNLELLKDNDCECKVLKSDIPKFLAHFEEFAADFIFLDPPYKIDPRVMQDIFSILSNNLNIFKNTTTIYEYFSKRDIAGEIGELKIIKNSHFGDKIVSYISV